MYSEYRPVPQTKISANVHYIPIHQKRIVSQIHRIYGTQLLSSYTASYTLYLSYKTLYLNYKTTLYLSYKTLYLNYKTIIYLCQTSAMNVALTCTINYLQVCTYVGVLSVVGVLFLVTMAAKASINELTKQQSLNQTT